MYPKRHFPSLTALKGLFILLIALHNTFALAPALEAFPGYHYIVLYGGLFGNSMFFLLSGFLLSWGYREKIRLQQIPFSAFLHRRLAKFYPIYLISNAAALIVAIFRYGFSVIDLRKVAFTLLLQMGGGLEDGNPYNSPTWFLSALFVCYIAYYLIASHAKKTAHYSLLIVFGIVWGFALLRMQRSLPFCYPGNGLAFLNFFIGCGLAEICHVFPSLLRRNLPLQAAVLAGLLLCAFLLLKYNFEVVCGDTYAAFSFLLCPLIFYLALAEGPCSRILQCKPLVSLGNISVSIFFWHLVVYLLFSHITQTWMPGQIQPWLEYGIYFAGMLIFSILYHTFSKKPLPANPPGRYLL